MQFKDVSSLSSGSYFAQQSRTNYEILVEGIIETVHFKLFILE